MKNPCVTIVACLHGDETFGLTVVDRFKNRLQDFPGLQLLIANEEAVAANRRFIDADLNRSFRTDSRALHEHRLAPHVLEAVRSSQYVLDIHNTTSSIRMTPIVTKLNDHTKKIIHLCNSNEIAFIQKPLADQSLIGHLNGGVSLEFSFTYAESPDALLEVEQIVDGLIFQRTREKKIRSVFCIDGSIPKSQILPVHTRNFHYIDSLSSYPFLLHERAYPEIHALSASRKYEEMI